MKRERKRFTAQDMREEANLVDCGIDPGKTVAKMLRQSANTEEENARLKSRLNAVVKECEKWKWADDSWLTDVNESILAHNRCVERIIKSARGDEVSK